MYNQDNLLKVQLTSTILMYEPIEGNRKNQTDVRDLPDLAMRQKQLYFSFEKR